MDAEWCHRSSPYRFQFQIQKAMELTGRVRELGGALLAAYEKGDAEALASIRAGHERDLLTPGIRVRQDQWRNADWQVQALQQIKALYQTNLLYYTTLYQNDLINDEQHLNLSNNAMQTRTGANIAGAIGEAFHVIPDSYVGALSTFVQIPTGTKLAGLFNTIAKIEAEIGPLGRRGHRPEVELRLPHAAGEVESVYLLCQYKSAENACAGSEDREERFRHALLSR